MCDFFKSWRRVGGVVVLSIACCCAIAWATSIRRVDTICLNCAKSNVVLLSACGQFWITYNTHVEATEWWPKRELVEVRVCPLNTFAPRTSSPIIEWHSMPADIAGLYQAFNASAEPIRMVHYSWLTIPLTVLSLYLLFGRTRRCS